MDQYLHDLHLRAGQLSGREKTCGKKTRYASEALALKAAEAHNRWRMRKHDVEPYPCAFCREWHIGGIMPVSLLEAMTSSVTPTPKNAAEPGSVLSPQSVSPAFVAEPVTAPDPAAGHISGDS